MGEEKELYEKAKEEKRLSERILSELPGFRGYKEKELRRETDRLIRNHAYKRLEKARGDAKGVFQVLSDRRVYETLTEMDRLIMSFDRVVEKINHAPYGYAGFFNVLKVQEEKLDKIIAFDSALLDQVQKIVDETSAFKEEVMRSEFGGARAHVQKLRDLLGSLEGTFDERGEVILGVK